MATSHEYARSKFIPIQGTRLDKVVEINQLSREVTQGSCQLEQLEQRLQQIRTLPPKPALEQIFVSALGSAAFCIIFGGDFADSAVAFIAGCLLWIYMLFVGYPRLSRIARNIIGGLLASFISVVLFKLGLGTHLSNIIIGAIIPLIPGVPFTNGIRDLANEDYLAGITRLLDAMLTFFCIAAGVAFAFILDAEIYGQLQVLAPLTIASETNGLVIQLLAAFVGTMAFSVLFSVPRKFYLDCGFCGMIGWFLYLLLTQNTDIRPTGIVFLSTALVAFTALILSIVRKCPITVFLICGIFPLVPGAGIFWTSYNIVSDHLHTALQTGFVAVKMTVAIAFGILVITELNSKNRIGKLFQHIVTPSSPSAKLKK